MPSWVEKYQRSESRHTEQLQKLAQQGLTEERARSRILNELWTKLTEVRKLPHESEQAMQALYAYHDFLHYGT